MTVEIIFEEDKHYRTYKRDYYINNGALKKTYIYKRILCDINGRTLSPDGSIKQRKEYIRIKTRSDVGGKHKIPITRKSRKDKGMKRTSYIMTKRIKKENIIVNN